MGKILIKNGKPELKKKNSIEILKHWNAMIY